MSEEIRPALSAEEWQRGMSFDGRAGLRWDGRAVLHYWGNTGAWVEIDPSDAHAIAAMGNAALPDDDPRKVLVDDVAWLRGLAIYLGAIGQESNAHRAVSLAAKLYAVMPPVEVAPPLPPQDTADAADRLGRRMGV